MSAPTKSMPRSRHPWICRPPCSRGWLPFSPVAELLPAVSEPLRWKLAALRRTPAADVVRGILASCLGPTADDWTPPDWLLPHQVRAARGVAGQLARFGTALLADAVGLGKTYTSLAVATRYRRTTAVVPACIVPQWERTAARLGVTILLRSHEGLSRGVTVPPSDLVIVDEAHRFRNDATRRYDALARGVYRADVLLVSATPVVNHPRDLVRLLRLGLADSALAMFGVPSLELEAEVSDLAALAHAADRLTTARSVEIVRDAGYLLPAVRDGSLTRAPSVEPGLLDRAIDAVHTLCFPGTMPATAHLLRLHLLHRLASSVGAFRGTVGRHLAYTDRALATDGSGAPSRRRVRDLLGPGDDLQFELWGASETDVVTVPCSAADLALERRRLLDILDTVRGDTPSPKAAHLADTCRRQRKTIVFTTSAETAHELASRLCWNRVGVVAAGRGRIATGAASVQRVLDLFAPVARGAAAPVHRRLALDVLIATDLASEGLDLQDADGVVHYDLPWTPVRLAQRIGRTVRLGSMHPAVRITWFTAPLPLERHLRTEHRLARKARLQMHLSAPATASTGRSMLLNPAIAAKELLLRDEAAVEPTPPVPCRVYAVVRGPMALIAAVRWHTRERVVDDVITLEGTPPQVVADPWRQYRLLTQLRNGVPQPRRVDAQLDAALIRVLRTRLQWAYAGDGSTATVAHRRRLLTAGVAAAKERDPDRIALLDRVLGRIRHGTRMGAARALDALLEEGIPRAGVNAWLRDTPTAPGHDPTVDVVAVLAGDGSLPEKAPGRQPITTCRKR